jgi:hypothetical protein
MKVPLTESECYYSDEFNAVCNIQKRVNKVLSIYEIDRVRRSLKTAKLQREIIPVISKPCIAGLK